MLKTKTLKSYKFLFYLIFFGFGITACSPQYYIPDTHNVPLISEKGETNASVSINPNQFQIQGAYGLTKNIAVKANGGFISKGRFFRNNRISSKYIELGAGYLKLTEFLELAK